MPSLRNILLDWSWKIAVLALPWQTRWFHEGIPLNGFPWENGRLSFYASWIPLLIVVIMAFVGKQERERVGELSSDRSQWLLFAGVGLIGFASVFTLLPTATAQWWVEVILLASFAVALARLRVTKQALATWFIIGLVPHALLGLQQYITQTVIASSWLGIAAQVPATPGVSVVEYAGGRFLRAYGGFPHPNIFGAWLAIALPLILWLATYAKHRRASLVWVSTAGVFALCLALTFSRGAWIAFLFGMVGMAYACSRRADVLLKTLVLTYATVFVLLFAGFLFLHCDLVVPRLQSETRLEQLSTHERTQSFKDGWTLFTQHPLVGVGPGTANLAIAQLRPTDRPPVPPHNVPLLALVEVGAIGMIGLALLLISAWRAIRPSFSTASVLMSSFVILGLFDYYHWSTWSGMVLAASIFIFAFPEPTNQ